MTDTTHELKGLDDENSIGEFLTLVSSDNCKFEVKRDIAMMSGLIKNVIDIDHEETTILLPYVNGAKLEKIIKYITFHFNNLPKEIKKPIIEINVKNNIDPWDIAFLEMPNNELFEMVGVANYLNISPLIELVCAKIATLIKNKTPDEIKKIISKK